MKREIISLSTDSYVLKAGEDSSILVPGPFESEEQALAEAKAHVRKIHGDEAIVVLPDGTEVSVVEEVEIEVAEEGTPAIEA